MVNMMNVLVPDIFPTSDADSWVASEDPSAQAAIMQSLGGKGTHMSTFHHMMALVSGTGAQVEQQLKEYTNQKAAGISPAQTCDTGIQSFTGSLTFQATAGSNGASNMCNPGNGVGVGFTVSAAFGLKWSAKMTKKSPCDLGKFSGAEKSLALSVWITNIEPPISELGELNINIGVDYALKDSGLHFTGFSMLFLLHKHTPLIPSMGIKSLMMALPQLMTQVFIDIGDGLITMVKSIISYFSSSSPKKGKGAEVVSSLLTTVLRIGYQAISELLFKSFEFLALKGGEKAAGASIKMFVEKLAENTATIKSLVSQEFTSTASKKRPIQAVHEDVLALELKFGDCKKPADGCMSFAINLIVGTLDKATISEPIAGGAYFFDLDVYALFNTEVTL